MKQAKAVLSLLLGLLLIALSMVFSVYRAATDAALFERAVTANVNAAALGTDDESLRGFAAHTVAYIRGDVPQWAPEISILGLPAGTFIPEAFTVHMAEVRGWVFAARTMLYGGAALSALLLLFLLTGGRGLRARWYWAGAGVPLALILAVCLWAAIDFDSLWRILHQLFIPGGIFSAAEPVMNLFPLQAFMAYLAPVALRFGLCALAALLLPPLTVRLRARPASRKGSV